MEEFNTLLTNLKEKHDYVKTGKLIVEQSNDIMLTITAKKDLSWGELNDLLMNDLIPFMRGEEMMKSIQRNWGEDAVKSQYPELRIAVHIAYERIAVSSFSHYYNTHDMTELKEENIQGYKQWYITVQKDIVKDVPDDLQQSISFE